MHNCKLISLIGFSQKVKNSLILSPIPSNPGIILPIANSVRFFNGKMNVEFFQAKNQVSAICINSPFVVVGQMASPGQLISVIFFHMNYPEGCKIFNYQKTKITELAVSNDGENIVSVGNSTPNVFELSIIKTEKQPEVGTKIFYNKVYDKSKGKIVGVQFSKTDPNLFIILFTNKMKMCKIMEEEVEQIEVKASKVRQFKSFCFSSDGQFCYLCSKNGDITQINLKEAKQTRVGPRKRVIIKGIHNIKYLDPHFLVISGKEGFVAIVELKEMRLIRQIAISNEQIINMTEINIEENCFFISTNKANIYKVDLISLDIKIYYSCSSNQINEITFVKDYSDIFGTCAGNQITIWKTQDLQPIIKISVPKITCNSLFFPKNGKYLISGWSDDCIRFFSPNKGKLIRSISPCNLSGVTVVITDEDITKVIAGGMNGMIRLWNINQNKSFGYAVGGMAYHNKKILCLKINPFNFNQLLCGCEDGFFTIWDFENFEMRGCFEICNFVKEIDFIDQMTILIGGSGGCLYHLIISNGKIKSQKQIPGTCVNSFILFKVDTTNENLVFYGGQEPFLYYFDWNLNKPKIIKIDSYGQITKIVKTPDQRKLIVGTKNGIILSYDIFAFKQVSISQLSETEKQMSEKLKFL